MGTFLSRDLEASKRFKKKLSSNSLCIMINLVHPVASLVESLAAKGADAILIDAEHGSVGRPQVEELSRAAALAGAAAIIRPEASRQHLITGYLGCGIDGFMLPQVSDPIHVRNLIDCLQRSAPMDFGDRVVILMIESLKAVENLPSLLSFKEIDAFMIAPADLAYSMGEVLLPSAKFSGQLSNVVDQAIAEILRANRACGMRVGFATAERYLNMGVSLLYTHAEIIIGRGMSEFEMTVASAKCKATKP